MQLLKKKKTEAREIAQQLKAGSSFLEDLSLVPSIPIAHIFTSRGPAALSGLCEHFRSCTIYAAHMSTPN